MTHFAELDENNTVVRVVAEQDYINSGADGDPAMWVQTCHNTWGGVHYDPASGSGADGATGGLQSGQPSADQTKALRKNYAGIGYTYDPQRDAFIPPKPHPDAVLDEQTCLWVWQTQELPEGTL